MPIALTKMKTDYKFIKKYDWWLPMVLYDPFAIRIAYYSMKIGLTANMLTICTVLFSILAAVSIMYGQFIPAAFLYFISQIFDASDGKLARMTHTTSKIGAKLDFYGDLFRYFFIYGALILKISNLAIVAVIAAHYLLILVSLLTPLNITDIKYRTKIAFRYNNNTKTAVNYYSTFEETFISLVIGLLINRVILCFIIAVSLHIAHFLIYNAVKFIRPGLVQELK
jgi:phosphatidylglycerophosphate synthase